jgi:hypothetical protein
MHKAEQVFLAKYADKKKVYMYHPPHIQFRDGTKYQADFLCVTDNTYFEIVGSKQAYYFNRRKYDKVVDEHPHLNFHIVWIRDWRQFCGDIGFAPRSVVNTQCVSYRRSVIYNLARKWTLRPVVVQQIIDHSQFTRQVPFARELAKFTGDIPISFIDPVYRSCTRYKILLS